MLPEPITSAQNPKIKRLLALQKDSSLRREAGLFVVEGQRELEHCLSAGFECDTIFICPALFDAGRGTAPGNAASRPLPLRSACGPLPLMKPRVATVSRGRASSGESKYQADRVFEVSEEVYEKVAYRGGTEGIIGEIKAKARTLDELTLPESPLIMVLESVEKPGNLGAVLRSADAAGADAVLICDPLTDLYNPNLIRASIGAVFTVPTVACSSGEAIAWLKAKGIQILTAQLQDSSLYYDRDLTRPTALVMGTESTGLSDKWRQAADAHIRIPMLGRLDSLNVSVSAAILLFEAVRQRQEPQQP